MTLICGLRPADFCEFLESTHKDLLKWAGKVMDYGIQHQESCSPKSRKTAECDCGANKVLFELKIHHKICTGAKQLVAQAEAKSGS